MTVTETKKPRSVLTHRRGRILNQQENLVSHPTGTKTLSGNPGDDFNEMVAAYHDDNAWTADVHLALEPLRPEEIKRRADYIKAVPGTSPWPASVTVHVVGNVIQIGRMDNPHDGWVMDANDNDAVIAVLHAAGRRARLNHPAPPDAA